MAIGGPASSMPSIRQALQWASARYGPVRLGWEGDQVTVSGGGLTASEDTPYDVVEEVDGADRIVLGRLNRGVAVVSTAAGDAFPHAIRPYPLLPRTMCGPAWCYPRPYPLLRGVERGAYIDGLGVV